MRIFTKPALAVQILALSLLAAAGLALQTQEALTESAPSAAPAVANLPPMQPTGPILLTVTGATARADATGADAAGTVRFDAAMLAALPRTSFATSTIWTEGVQTFSGVELRSLVDYLGITGGTLKIIAINNYSVQIPVSELVAGGALLADQRDGKPMSLRDKGPLWVVYPYDSGQEFRNEVVYSRSVWQVDRIEVLP